MMKLLLFVILFSVPLFGQLSGNAQLVLFPGSPTGSCTSRQLGMNQSNATLYVCINNAWQLETASGGGGNATGLNFGGTSIPLGTPAPTSGQFLMYNGTSIVGGSPAGGGTGLNGCATATAGNLVCDNSVQGGTTSVGMLMLPYSSSGLPTPPSTAQAAIAADATGHLFSSTGNSAAFTAIGSGGGTGTAGVTTFNGRSGAVMPDVSDYSAFFAPIGTTGGGPMGGVTVIE